MYLFPNEKQEEERLRVRTFAEEVIAPEAAQLDEEERFSSELTLKMGEQGLLSMVAPKIYGGEEKETLSYIIAVEELARVDSSQAATVVAHNSLGLVPIMNYGTTEQKEKYLPKLTSGRYIWGFGLTEENAGSDAGGTETTAVRDGDEWVINGSKRYITNASTPLTLGVTLQVMTNDNNGQPKLSTILVENGTPGFEAKRMLGKMMWRAVDTAQLTFKDCRVPYSNLLGQEGQGLRYMLKTLDGGRLSVAAMGLGLAQGAFEMALKHAKSRKQFGRLIGRNQAIGFKLADMNMKIELARNTLYRTCVLKDNGYPYSKEAAMAKLYTSEIAKEIADEAVQIFGGSGLFKDNPIERFYRDQRLLQVGEGTSEILRLIIARGLGL
ncbi:MAG: acyl-CoA dehydrogenase family protein [Dysgonamonadaceae bacterium]|nr:acyl-CoA dehydrogenase family protein [Dysgonamonadaceae bacterium]MDD3356539.1 acyl-CoA dehydrogenase family protein [Dysgonamonadaceae bacterium]MDD3727522.1 acyl-CoA dehydrogenase family protein [Dysgonamonadaceae bacterium]MDD4246985.1 acyl-CoA dehydrogenase family protein [Dysgonamonadaceae bacterium]MDD4605622.1 acyl-CoA dehydrogenase family protein [Dysgonamonadaceae bacterium]